MSAPDVSAGTVADVTYRGETRRCILQESSGERYWESATPWFNGDTCIYPRQFIGITAVVPLAVLGEDDAERLAKAYMDDRNIHGLQLPQITAAMKNALCALATPLAEPLDPAARVIGSDGSEWARNALGYWVCISGPWLSITRTDWAELLDNHSPIHIARAEQ